MLAPAAVAADAGMQVTPALMLAAMRTRCASSGMPETVDWWLRHTHAWAVPKRAVVLQCLCLALADDLTPPSPLHPRSTDPRSAACAVFHHATSTQSLAALEPYRQALLNLESAVRVCGQTLPGTYGFVLQSAAARQLLQGAPPELPQVLAGWMHWQWAALAAAHDDPLMRSGEGHDRLAPLRVGYALDASSAEASDIIDALREDFAIPGQIPRHAS